MCSLSSSAKNENVYCVLLNMAFFECKYSLEIVENYCLLWWRGCWETLRKGWGSLCVKEEPSPRHALDLQTVSQAGPSEVESRDRWPCPAKMVLAQAVPY